MYQKWIKAIKSKLNLSVTKLADKIDISARTITGYERGERIPSIEFLANLNTILSVKANWFLTGKGNMFLGNITQQDEQLEKLVAQIVDKEIALR